MIASVNLKSISPVSWGGHNADADPIKVRIPSIRGSLRKWYRWYLASKCREPNVKEIWSKEYEVFGGVHGESPKKSSVSFKFDELKVLRELTLDNKSPFLWALRKRPRRFYLLDFKLIMKGPCESLLEAAKALALNVSLGGFGFRGNRGYGSFRITHYDSECGEVDEVLRLAIEATASTGAEWVRRASALLRGMGIKPCENLNVFKVQNLSNCYLVHLGAHANWRDALKYAEFKLKMVERRLRARNRRNRDYRVILGSPVMDPFRRRPFVWKFRRSSPLVLGLSGRGNAFVRGVFMPSSDYPVEVLRHLASHSLQNLIVAFEQVISAMFQEGFKLSRWG